MLMRFVIFFFFKKKREGKKKTNRIFGRVSMFNDCYTYHPVGTSTTSSFCQTNTTCCNNKWMTKKTNVVYAMHIARIYTFYAHWQYLSVQKLLEMRIHISVCEHITTFYFIFRFYLSVCVFFVLLLYCMTKSNWIIKAHTHPHKTQAIHTTPQWTLIMAAAI